MDILNSKVVHLPDGKGLYVMFGRRGEEPCEFAHFRLQHRETAREGIKRVLGVDWVPPTKH